MSWLPTRRRGKNHPPPRIPEDPKCIWWPDNHPWCRARDEKEQVDREVLQEKPQRVRRSAAPSPEPLNEFFPLSGSFSGDFTMAYIAPIHRPTSVRQAVKLNLIDPEEECLVVARTNRLEIYSQTPGGLVLRHSRIVNGTIIALEKLHPANSLTAHLFVCTEQNVFFTLSWDAAGRRLQTEQKFVDVSDKTGRLSHAWERCFVDERNRFFAMSLYEGLYTFAVTRYKHMPQQPEGAQIGALMEEPVPVRIGEILLRSSTFLHYRTNYDKDPIRIASLYQDTQDRTWLKVRVLVPSKKLDFLSFEKETILRPGKIESTASHLIPVPNPANGLLVLAETCITWIDDHDQRHKVHALDMATEWTCWTAIDHNRWLLADGFGYLYFLMMNLDDSGDKPSGFQLDKLGSIVQASKLVYLDGGCVFIGSHYGDSQVVRITPNGVQVVQVLSNIGPILDFTILDLGNRSGEGQANEFSSGQARLVTGSGAYKDGTLRSIRSGVGVQQISSLDLYPPGAATARAATNMFHIQLDQGSPLQDLLLVSYVDETRIFAFGPDEQVEEVQQMVTHEPTILAKMIRGKQIRILQCTSKNVTIYALAGQQLQLEATWVASGDNTIVAASASDNHLVISVGGTELVALDISESSTDNRQIAELRRRKFDQLVSCIDVPNIVTDFVLVGFWQSTRLSILNMPNLTDRHSTGISDDSSAVPRSVLLTQVLPDHPPTLFLSLADGHVVTFDVDKRTFGLSNRQSTILGSQHANLKILPRSDQLSSVFAIAEHSTLIYGSENRLVYSAVTAEEATCICSFDSWTYGGAVALATPTGIQIANVERERTTHIDTLAVGESVRRIAYSGQLRVFGMATIKRDLIDGAEVVTSSFKLGHEISFSLLSEYPLREDEIVESLGCMQLEEEGKRVERFVLGTSYLGEESDVDNPRGRILVFAVSGDQSLRLVTEMKLKGACRALAQIDGKIVAALVKTIVVYAYQHGRLTKLASYRCATTPTDVYVEDDTIVVSDLMKSVAQVKYIKGKDGAPDRMHEVSRHFQLCWSTAITPVEPGVILEADADGNLLVLQQNSTGATEEDRRMLEVISEMNLGEMVNKMRPIRVPVSPNAIVNPRAFLVTTQGGIYMFGQIRHEMQTPLMDLQAALAEVVRSPGDIPWTTYRACHNTVRSEREPLRFVDGELIESFLDLDPDTQNKVVLKLNTTLAQVRNTVETLRRMH